MAPVSSDFVPLQLVQERFGDLTHIQAQAAKGRAVAKASFGDEGLAWRNHATVPTSIVKEFDTYQPGMPSNGFRTQHEEAAQTEAHGHCLRSLSELKDLAENELDLTWQSVQASQQVGLLSEKLRNSSDQDELILHLEMQSGIPGGSRGSAQPLGLRMRTSPTWEVQPLQMASNEAAGPTWSTTSRRPSSSSRQGSKRASSARGSYVGGLLDVPVSNVPASSSTTISLREEESASILLRRRSPGSDTDLAQSVFQTTPGAGTSSQARMSRLEMACAKLAKVLALRVSEIGAALAAPREDKAGGAQETERWVQQGLRDVREAIRLVAQALPPAAKLCEVAVKALVLSLDTWFSAKTREQNEIITELQDRSSRHAYVEAMEREVTAAKRENKMLTQRMATMERRLTAEARANAEKLRIAQEEVERLTPDPNNMKHVSGLMSEYQHLMYQMEVECRKQGEILQNMAEYTRDVVNEATGDAMRPRRKENGRLVELESGEILLRPYDVADASTQVKELDLLLVDLDGPIKFRGRRCRQIMHLFASQPAPTFTMEELSKEIEKIYLAKLAADADHDKSGMPRSDLADFVVEYYLDTSASLKEAERQLCGMLRSIMRERNPLPAKVALFARFLECADDQKRALPPGALDVAMRAKRQLQAKGTRGLLVPGLRGGQGVKFRSDGEEQLLGIAAVYEIAVKALPANSIPALRELFAGLARRAESEQSTETRFVGNKFHGSRELLVLLLLLHSRLHQEGAPRMQDLIAKAEVKGAATSEDFRDAILDAQILGVPEATWRSNLALAGGSGSEVSGDFLLEYLGGGSAARLPKVGIRETPFLETLMEAVVADYDSRLVPLERLWDRQYQGEATAMSFSDFKSLALSFEPSMQPPALRAWYIAISEATRSCTQIMCEAPPVEGTIDAVQGRYGGELFNWRTIWHGALQQRLFLPEGFAGTPVAGQRDQLHSQSSGVGLQKKSTLSRVTQQAMPPVPQAGRRGRVPS